MSQEQRGGFSRGAFWKLEAHNVQPHQHPILVESRICILGYRCLLPNFTYFDTSSNPRHTSATAWHPCGLAGNWDYLHRALVFSPRRHPAFAESCDGKLENVEIFMSSYENVLTETAAVYVPRRNIKVACVFINVRRPSPPNRQLMCELEPPLSKHVISATLILLPHPFLLSIE